MTIATAAAGPALTGAGRCACRPTPAPLVSIVNHPRPDHERAGHSEECFLLAWRRRQCSRPHHRRLSRPVARIRIPARPVRATPRTAGARPVRATPRTASARPVRADFRVLRVPRTIPQDFAACACPSTTSESGYPATLFVPAGYPTIGAAVAAAPPGYRIIVGPGTYPEDVTLTKPLTIMGHHATIDATNLNNGFTVLRPALEPASRVSRSSTPSVEHPTHGLHAATCASFSRRGHNNDKGLPPSCRRLRAVSAERRWPWRLRRGRSH